VSARLSRSAANNETLAEFEIAHARRHLAGLLERQATSHLVLMWHADDTVTVPPRLCAHTSPPCKTLTDTGHHCPYHTRHVEGLEVRTSRLPNAGQGLFTVVERKRGTLITFYTGIEHPKSSDVQTMYALQLTIDRVIDARRTDASVARFINDPGMLDVHDPRINCQVEKKTGLQIHALQGKDGEVHERSLVHAAVIATRDINAGEELYMSYGAAYWTPPKRNVFVM
jgi:hypothetical protein